MRERPRGCPLALVGELDTVGARPLTAGERFRTETHGNTRRVRTALIVSVFVSLGSVLVYLGLLLWAAREDGRDQRRRDRRAGRSSG